MGKIIIYIAVFILIINNLHSFQKGIDTVYFFNPGTGQKVGQSAEYFPENIFGIPSRDASYDTPESSPDEICSLGKGGEIIVGFSDIKLYDGPGADFIIFENAFHSPLTNGIFAEPAIVAVSMDGIEYFEFPYDTVSLSGMAGKTPTYGSNNPFNPNESGGDAFDISELGLDFIKYIKIKDLSHVVGYEGHQYYSPPHLITGFDLDAVVGLYLGNQADISENNNSNFNIHDAINHIEVISSCHYDISNILIMNIYGQILFQSNFINQIRINKNILSSGVYFLRVYSKRSSTTYKFNKL